jgi:hypothetical protein
MPNIKTVQYLELEVVGGNFAMRDMRGLARTVTLLNGTVLIHAQNLFTMCSARLRCRSKSQTRGYMASIVQNSGMAMAMEKVRKRVPRSLAHLSSLSLRVFLLLWVGSSGWKESGKLDAVALQLTCDLMGCKREARPFCSRTPAGQGRATV